MPQSLQDRYAPHNCCFGCGPSNDEGLRIKSFVKGDEVVAEFRPETHHEAFEGMLSGGIIGTLLDCHSNWTAAWHLMEKAGEEHPPCTVTAEYHVKMRAPTPTDTVLRLRARVSSSGESSARVSATIEAHGDVTATCEGVFVAVKPGHPAYHRW
ncbi:MAG: PaaI family thioesterase [Planctomycetota bacterium]|jgi:acyl-coenzyme A thioesterase PaaI-like protein